MRARIPLVLSIVCGAAFLAVTAQTQQPSPAADAPSATSAQAQGSDHAVEGTVASMTRHTMVVRSDDNQYQLFTYAPGFVPAASVKPGARVRVTGGAPDESGSRVADSIVVIQPAPSAAGAGAQAAPPPPQVNGVSKQIESEARKWHVGGKIGTGLSPNLFMFGPQAQFGPFFSPHLMFRPDVEFGFGELTDMYAINTGVTYRFGTTFQHQWTPYLGMGPSFNFISQSASSGNVSFSNFNYKTGFNIFVGAQKRKMFVEIKTALWSAQTPVFRMFIGYNF